LVVFDKGTDC